jgi:hypothetical protein
MAFAVVPTRFARGSWVVGFVTPTDKRFPEFMAELCDEEEGYLEGRVNGAVDAER